MSTGDADARSEAGREGREGREGGDPDDDRADGRFGDYGGQYVPEALVPAVEELAEAHRRYVRNGEDGFLEEFRERLADFGGRPTPLQRADRLSARYDREVYLKREDLLHGGAHKLNNALGQALLAKYLGKDRVIAETGAGQHGVATAMACAHLGLDCTIYMGRTDVNRQRPNVFRMRSCGAAVRPVDVGRGTLKEAISETMRDWAGSVETTHYVVGSVVGPHPFPTLARDFQSVIGEELRRQVRERTGDLPGSVLACAGGGSNTIGTFHDLLDDDVALYAVEAGGSSLGVDEEAGVAPNSATLSTGDRGVLHGARTKVLQDEDGQIVESHSVSAGLDYAGVGPELAHLVDRGRVQARTVDDDAALRAFHRLARLEGILPALETAHAFGFLERAHQEGEQLAEPIVINVSGRGDKDLETVIEESTARGIDLAPSMDVFDAGAGGHSGGDHSGGGHSDGGHDADRGHGGRGHADGDHSGGGHGADHDGGDPPRDHGTDGDAAPGGDRQ